MWVRLLVPCGLALTKVRARRWCLAVIGWLLSMVLRSVLWVLVRVPAAVVGGRSVTN